ncbi:hypothetical protein NQ315_003299 [Exocentrus adspersus]|uniref:Uncharacterized protein n=1 Tax=Exocentrus adspersus TaxID=1586481 RepID=A0AAV8VAB5_9CUCU|nr:hypothetical protein NQ315_003299 [Exocentrus adspersus]
MRKKRTTPMLTHFLLVHLLQLQDFRVVFVKKRKTTENAVERRHKEKMARQDRYLEIFESLVNTLKKDKEN